LYSVVTTLTPKEDTLITCPRCRGFGNINTDKDDEKTGAAMRRIREKSGISLRAVARIMEKSPAYISLLEHGKQRWNPVLEKQYKDIVTGK
jgi:predicted transcriptional regulator